MFANADNALFYLVSTLFELYLWVLLLRIILQWVRADFYNPFSQLVWRLTQPIVRWLQPIIPRWRTLDGAALVVTIVIAVIYVEAIIALLNYRYLLGQAVVFALLKLVVLTLNLYTFTLFVQAILSWVGPGVSNPAGSVLWSVNEPILRPVRRVLPPVAGLDLSPLVLILALQVLNRLVPLPGIFR
jgi:YggT family protein